MICTVASLFRYFVAKELHVSQTLVSRTARESVVAEWCVLLSRKMVNIRNPQLCAEFLAAHDKCGARRFSIIGNAVDEEMILNLPP